MDYFLDIALSKLPYNMRFITKYVDDLLAIIPSKHLSLTLNTLSNVHQKIQFTSETEKEGKLLGPAPDQKT